MMSVSSHLVVLNTIGAMSFVQSIGEFQEYNDGMTLAYMEKIFTKYSFQGGKGRKSRRRKKKNHKKVVLAKGLDPVETNVNPNYVDLYWRITNKTSNNENSQQNSSITQLTNNIKRSDLKNARLVLTLKKLTPHQHRNHLHRFRLQYEIDYEKKGMISNWRDIRSFKITGSNKERFVVIGISSVVRRYLKMVNKRDQDEASNIVPQLKIRISSKPEVNGASSVDHTFHVLKSAGTFRPFILFSSINFKRKKKTLLDHKLKSDKIIKRHALGSARNALPTTKKSDAGNGERNERCHLENNVIDFREGTTGDRFFNSRLLHPSLLNIKKCVGSCLCRDGSCHADDTGIDITNHARFKGMISSSWQENGRGQTRGQMLQDVKTQCVPVAYKPQSLYLLDDDNIPTIIMLNDLVASKCGCR